MPTSGTYLANPLIPLYEWATYTANLCPIHCGGAAGHSRRRTTILHSEGGYCKRFLRDLTSKPWEPVQTGLWDSL
jgi:hypothetical protein